LRYDKLAQEYLNAGGVIEFDDNKRPNMAPVLEWGRAQAERKQAGDMNSEFQQVAKSAVTAYLYAAANNPSKAAVNKAKESAMRAISAAKQKGYDVAAFESMLDEGATPKAAAGAEAPGGKTGSYGGFKWEILDE
jgi:hypothetical protein